MPREIPKETLEQTLEKLKTEDKNTYKVLKAVFMLQSKKVNCALKEEGEAFGVEKIYESLEELWNKGYIKFAFDEEEGSIYLLIWNDDLDDYIFPPLYGTSSNGYETDY